MTLRILVNLPRGFTKNRALTAAFKRLGALGTVRSRSWNTPDEIRSDLRWADAVIMWSWPMLDDALLDQAPGLRFVGCIDVTRTGAQILLNRFMPVSTSRRCWSPAVAEMALTLMLTALRGVSTYHAQMRQGKEPWVTAFPDDINPHERELTGRPVGIIGFGAVGRRLTQLLAPFQCQLRIHDPFAVPDQIIAAGGVPASLPELLKASDVVTLCAASNSGTAHLIGAPQLRMLRPHAILVNVARAALVDTSALVARLSKGDLTACLDVFDQEPLAKSAAIRRLPTAFLTPHRAGGVLSSVERAITMLVDDLQAHLANGTRQWALTPAMLPGLDG